jgi:hypothetical protein
VAFVALFVVARRPLDWVPFQFMQAILKGVFGAAESFTKGFAQHQQR